MMRLAKSERSPFSCVNGLREHRPVRLQRTWFEEIQPVLLEGMNFLRDDGLQVGCYCNRYVYHVDENGNLLDKGFRHYGARAPF